MSLRMTETEFKEFCAKHPSIKARSQACSRESLSVDKTPAKPPKYRNRKVYVYAGGLALYKKDERFGSVTAVYDSEKEYKRHNELMIAEKAGMICNLKRQVPFQIQEPCERHGKKINAIVYKADFCYERNGERVVEDVKGFDEKKQKHITTKDFNLKWKLLQYKYPDFVFEIF